MKRYLVVFFAFILAVQAHCQQSDNFGVRHPVLNSVSFGGNFNHVFTPQVVAIRDIQIKPISGISASLYFKPNRLTLIDSLFGEPRFGLGIYKPYFQETELLGEPYSIYLAYNLTLKRFSYRWSLGLEFRLGASLGWHPYSSETNIDNRLLGAKNNYHAAGNLYLQFKMSRYLSSRLGVEYTHNSDGSYKLPNVGANTLGLFGDFMVRLNSKNRIREVYPLPVVAVRSHFEFDLGYNLSARQVLAKPEGANYSAIIPNSFLLMSVDGFLMYVANPYLRAGVGLKLIYDESTDIAILDALTTGSAIASYSYRPSSVKQRFSPGFFGVAEVFMGYLSSYLQMGYIATSNQNYTQAICMEFGGKSHLYRSLFAKFGVQFVPRHKTSCTTFGIGYTFNHDNGLRKRGMGGQ